MANSKAVTRGKFITVEGQDGAGKSTNIAVIAELLNTRNIDFRQSREPGGTPFGETIRELILNSDDDAFGDKAELLLMFAARAQHIAAVIEPALASGQWVLCDRFTDASYAYQGGGRGVNMQDIFDLEQTVQGELRPDLTILLDLPIALGESRAGARSKADRFEQQQLDFKQRVRDAYLDIARRQPQRVKVVDASASFNGVEQAISKIMQEFLEAQAANPPSAE